MKTIQKKYLIAGLCAISLLSSTQLYAEEDSGVSYGNIDVVNKYTQPIYFNTNGAGKITLSPNNDSQWVVIDKSGSTFNETTSIIGSDGNKICDISYSFNDNQFVYNYGDGALIYFNDFTQNNNGNTIEITMNNYAKNKIIITNNSNQVSCNFLPSPGNNDFEISTSFQSEPYRNGYMVDATFVVEAVKN